MSRLLDEIPAVTDRDAPALAVWNALTDLWTQVQDDGVKLSPLARAQFLRAGAHACEASNREGRGAVANLSGMQAAVDELRAKVAEVEAERDAVVQGASKAITDLLTAAGLVGPFGRVDAADNDEVLAKVRAIRAERDALRSVAVRLTRWDWTCGEESDCPHRNCAADCADAEDCATPEHAHDRDCIAQTANDARAALGGVGSSAARPGCDRCRTAADADLLFAEGITGADLGAFLTKAREALHLSCGVRGQAVLDTVLAEVASLRAQLAVTVTCEACDGKGENPRYTPDGEDDGEEACAPCSGAGELSLGTIATARIEARRRPAAPETPTTTDDEDLPW